MTIFEITIIALLTIIMLMVVILVKTAIEGFHGVWKKQDTILGDTMVLKAYFNNLLERFDNISRQLDNIESNNDQDFEKLTDIVDKMHRNLCVDIADKMVDRVYPPTYNPPCYSPNGICTNPQMDCINCPKRGTGGTWSINTSIKAKGEMFQEKFNDNKED
jgi:hypothetical protein